MLRVLYASWFWVNQSKSQSADHHHASQPPDYQLPGCWLPNSPKIAKIDLSPLPIE
ncbi:hypothetical protein [Thermoleptolyngbya sp.]